MPKSRLQLHNNENNPESQKHLENNAQKFSQQCLKILEILNQGKRITVMSAMTYGIASLPRRLKDLRDRNGINNINEAWVKGSNGKNSHKEWWIEITTRPTKGEVVQKAIKKHLPKTSKSKSKWVQPNLL